MRAFGGAGVRALRRFAQFPPKTTTRHLMVPISKVREASSNRFSGVRLFAA